MYIPRSHAEDRPEELAAFVAAHPLGTLVTATPAAELYASHLPFIFHPVAGEHGILEAHLARANRHHELPRGGEALVVFTGPDAHITPNWYAEKATHGRVVPTWNYIAVHAYGMVRFIEDEAWLRQHLDRLVDRHESERAATSGAAPAWRVEDAPPEFITQQLKAIVGVEVRVTRLEGKWKMSQNRSAESIDGVIAGLAASPKSMDHDVAAIVAARRPRRG